MLIVAACVADADIIFWPVVSFFFFFPRLFSAVADWMSTILPHMIWPKCEFRMQVVWNVLHGARWSTGRKNCPKIARLRTIGQICRAISSQLWHISTMGKKLLNSNISPTCLHNMVNFGPLMAEIYWRFWGTPANFNGFRVLASLRHRRRSTEVNQTLHDVCVTVSWDGTLYTFWEFLSPN